MDGEEEEEGARSSDAIFAASLGIPFPFPCPVVYGAYVISLALVDDALSVTPSQTRGLKSISFSVSFRFPLFFCSLFLFHYLASRRWRAIRRERG